MFSWATEDTEGEKRYLLEVRCLAAVMFTLSFEKAVGLFFRFAGWQAVANRDGKGSRLTTRSMRGKCL